MPHVHIQHFPKEFTDEQTKQLAEAITAVIVKHSTSTTAPSQSPWSQWPRRTGTTQSSDPRSPDVQTC